jgi:LPXTG-motif cell wall-anchored protein
MGEHVFPEPTQPLRRSSRPHGSTEADFSDSSEFAVEEATSDQITLENPIPAAPGGSSRQQMLPSIGGAGGSGRYASGAPQWPLPKTGLDKRVALAAIAGLTIAIIALIFAAPLVGIALQSALTSPTGTPSRVVSASASPHSQQTAAVPTLPTGTQVPTTNWLVITPTQVVLDCQGTQGVTLQLTNTGPEAVSWAAETSSSHHSRVAVQPASGSLTAGATQAITISISTGQSNGGQGSIQFAVVSDQQTTNPAEVNYTTSGCGGD